MKKRNLKEVQFLALHKRVVSKLYGGINDDGDDEGGPVDKPHKPIRQPNDHTRGCVSWNVAC